VKGARQVTIDGRTLTPETIERVALGASVSLAPAARERMQASRRVVERAVDGNEVVYGVTTGFGRLADTVIPMNRIRELQLNLVRSHAVGVGEPFDEPVARAITLLRAHTLAGGFCGTRPVVCERLLDLLNAGIWPRIPGQGSVGASWHRLPTWRWSWSEKVRRGSARSASPGPTATGAPRPRSWSGPGWIHSSSTPRKGSPSSTEPRS
jgi:histidine ammonia-lyase